MIPRIIHQTWKSPDIPEHLREFQQSWRILHPEFEYRLWTDADNDRLIHDDYPQFVEFFHRISQPITKVDFIRVAYMHRFGGIYADVDFEALRPFDPLLNDSKIVVGRETGGIGNPMRGRDFVLNALIISPAGHPVWLEIMNEIATRYRHRRMFEPLAFYVIRMAIEVFDHVLEKHARDHDDITIEPHEMFYPAPPSVRLVQTRRELARDCGSFAIHHYENSWFGIRNRLANIFLRRSELRNASRKEPG
ncbi:glycosyltransferase [Prosthecobacter sp.]|uniref:glycosyltransferase family 32 protein n=1 Tax=Prosthecobacter sp. TaxID=1965333 RepID=UPI001D3154E7|nr:glycosyltransferase [Prosthecobacter sp.]MCB1277640.1 hypothetical protein [Prosthecobacter sp.]